MPDLRWYLKREGGEIALVCERRNDRRGYQVIVRDRRHARQWLPELRRHVLAIDACMAMPVRMFSLEEVDG